MTIQEIRQRIEAGQLDDAERSASRLIDDRPDSDTLAAAYYLRGLTAQRRGDTRQALNDFLAAIELNPDGPATQAYRMTQDILNFYDHDLYNP